MNLLKEYLKLAEDETNNEFPEEMQNEGLTEEDRELYEEVLAKMRNDMDEATQRMKEGIYTDSSGSIENKSYKLSDEMKRFSNPQYENGKMKFVSEPIGFCIETYRCPKCGRLMFENDNKFYCSNCGHNESGNEHMRFVLVDSTYTKIPLGEEYNETLCEMFKKANINIRTTYNEN